VRTSLVSLRNAVVCALWLSCCGYASAQNVVVNPDFDIDVSSWIPNGATVGFDSAQNIVGTPGSGSILVTNNIGNGATVSVRQCIDVPLSVGTYDFGGWILFPTGQVGTGSAGIAVSFYPAANCGGISLAFLNVPIIAANTWSLQTATLAAPPGVLSAAVALRIDMPMGSAAPLDAWFDGVRLGPAPTLPVELQSFEVD